MSQRGPASRPPSRRTSISPRGDETGSPTAASYSTHPGGSDGRHHPASIGHNNGSYLIQQIPPRTLGVHNILNPSDAQHVASSEEKPPDSQPLSHAEVSTSGASSGAYGPPPFFAGQPVSRSHPGTPVGSAMALSGPSPSDRHSRSPNFRYPAMNNPRKLLSPKPPRAASVSHALPRDPETRQSPFAAAPSTTKRPLEPEAPEESSARLPGLRYHHDVPPAGTPPIATPPRSLSQPAVLQLPGGPFGPQPSGPPPTGPPRDLARHPSQAPARPHHQHGLSPARSFSTSGTAEEGSSQWPEASRLSTMGEALTVEGQQAFINLPGADGPIRVEVDTMQGSRKADERRKRNADASTRHRKKKKTEKEENSRQLQDLKDERQEMMQEIEDLSQQRDFYRHERNRLRDLVSRTPGISEHAAGPPSPPPRSVASFAEASPTPASLGIATPSGYASEPSATERPAPRRRLDALEFSTPVYGAPSSGTAPPTLPPMHGQAYGLPSRPSSASSAGSGERLPPLTSLDGPRPSTQSLGPRQVHEQDPRTRQWVPAQPRQYETGWATAPRNPLDGPPKGS